MVGTQKKEGFLRCPPLYNSHKFCMNTRMRKRIFALCLTIGVILGYAWIIWDSDFRKGLTAYKRGDYATALHEWTPLAEQGDAYTQFSLGVMYLEGRGVPQDDQTAVTWYRRAAEQGDAAAQTNLGWMYANGRGVPQDDKTAVTWYRRAAEQGVAKAQTFLGGMYATGRGVPQDAVYAHMWFNIAASSGNKFVVKARDSVAGKMTRSQRAKAQDLARECVRKKYQGC
jgi:TPR repeat protein